MIGQTGSGRNRCFEQCSRPFPNIRYDCSPPVDVSYHIIRSRIGASGDAHAVSSCNYVRGEGDGVYENVQINLFRHIYTVRTICFGSFYNLFSLSRYSNKNSLNSLSVFVCLSRLQSKQLIAILSIVFEPPREIGVLCSIDASF